MGNGDDSLGDDCDLSVSKKVKTPARGRKRPNEPAICYEFECFEER